MKASSNLPHRSDILQVLKLWLDVLWYVLVAVGCSFLLLLAVSPLSQGSTSPSQLTCDPNKSPPGMTFQSPRRASDPCLPGNTSYQTTWCGVPLRLQCP